MSGVLAAALFLSQLYPLLQTGKVVLAPRNAKTRIFMAENDLRTSDVLAILSQLKKEHYHWGPDSDDNGTPGNVFCFLYPWRGIKMYVKAKIWTDEHGKQAAVMSFHPEGMHNV